jgi:cytoskeleton protein RodZ
VPFELLPALPAIAVTQPRSVPFELLPALPAIAVTQPRSVPFELLPALPAIAVTEPRSVRFEYLPPLPAVAVTESRSVRFELLPPLPAVAATQARSVRPELLPALPVVVATQPVSLRADLMPEAPPARIATLLLPMPVPSRIDVTSRVSPRAELLPQRLQTQLPSGTRYGVQNRNSRITLRVHSPTIVAVRDGRNRIFIDRELAPGDTYRVPNRAGLWLTALDADAVEIVLDGASVGFAGSQDGTVRDLSLNPQNIAARFKGASPRSVSRPTVRTTPRRATGTSKARQRTRR